ncbi:hypothetical protein MMC20_002829 [Loxospora ochrophaea]|nr:hypothetical protein [Loxospora ochrophaea]
MSSPNVLSSRDINTSAPASTFTKAEADNQPKTMEYHRQVLKSRMEEDKSKQTYVSPSDNIMSPCTAKLSAYKNKHFMKAKPQSLFAKTSSKNMLGGESAKEGVSVADVEDVQKKESTAGQEAQES